MVVDTDGAVKIFHLNVEAPTQVLSTPDEEILVASFSPDSSKVITISVGWIIRVWNTEQGDCAGILSSGNEVSDISIAWTAC